MNICSTHLKLKKCLAYVTSEWNLQHFTKNCKIKNLDDFKKDETHPYLWRAGPLNVKEK